MAHRGAVRGGGGDGGDLGQLRVPLVGGAGVRGVGERGHDGQGGGLATARSVPSVAGPRRADVRAAPRALEQVRPRAHDLPLRQAPLLHAVAPPGARQGREADVGGGDGGDQPGGCRG